MSRFVRLATLDPYQAFAVLLRRSRPAMERAYLASFEAHRRCSELLRDHLFASVQHHDMAGFPIFDEGDTADVDDQPDLDALWIGGIAEDYAADLQAAPVVLTADSQLRLFGKRVLKRQVIEPGFGPLYKSSIGDVRLTTLLWAAANAIRHVEEWDDNPDLARLPYPEISSLRKGSDTRRAMQSISVIQRAFGIGIHELVRDPVSCRVLVAVDAPLGLVPPAYARFEEAVLQAAREIADAAGGDARTRLESALVGAASELSVQ